MKTSVPLFRSARICCVIVLAILLAGGCSFRTRESSQVGLAAAKTAQRYLGVPYVYGGRSPKGFDCSGLALYVYKQQGVEIPPTAQSQARAGRAVPQRNLLPGDLVFFKTNGRFSGVSHVGIYIGNGQFIHAPGSGDRVKKAELDSNYFKSRYHGARRIQ